QHPQEKRTLAQGPPQRAISFHADKRVLAQPGRDMVLDLAGAVAQRDLLHKPQAASGAHRCLRQRVQRQSRALRLDQEKGPSTSFQRPPYHSALIPSTSAPRSRACKRIVMAEADGLTNKEITGFMTSRASALRLGSATT